jgi:hypothetical protein
VNDRLLTGIAIGLNWNKLHDRRQKCSEPLSAGQKVSWMAYLDGYRNDSVARQSVHWVV